MYHAYRENYKYLHLFDARKIYESLNKFDERSNYVFTEYGNGNSSNVLNALDACYSSIENTCFFLKDYAHKFKQNGLKSKVFGTLRHLEVAMEHFDMEKKQLNHKFNYRKPNKPKVVYLKKNGCLIAIVSRSL